VNVRILAATKQGSPSGGQGRTIREDLFYRLNVIPIHLPPLRDRRNDIPCWHVTSWPGLPRTEEDPGGFQSRDHAHSSEYEWPGNVRELENCIEHAAVLAKDPAIEPGDLPPLIFESGNTDSSRRRRTCFRPWPRKEKETLWEALERCN